MLIQPTLQSQRPPEDLFLLRCSDVFPANKDQLVTLTSNIVIVANVRFESNLVCNLCESKPDAHS